MSRLWAPAAAMVSARFACSCPRTSARSDGRAAVGCDGGAAVTSDRSRPDMRAHREQTRRRIHDRRSRTSAASIALSAGSTKARPSRRAPSVIGERAADRAQCPGQRQLAGEFVRRERAHGS